MNIIRLIKDQIIDYQRYEQGLIKVIGHPDYRYSDCLVNDFHSYAEWITIYNQYPVIKVEGIETIPQVKKRFSNLTIDNIHLFVNQKYGLSFNWHKDDVDVYLYVVKGRKTLQVKNKTYIINPGQGVFIPKGHLHRARSCVDTWALSVGCK